MSSSLYSFNNIIEINRIQYPIIDNIEQIEKSNIYLLYKNPLTYLFLLPGIITFILLIFTSFKKSKIIIASCILIICSIANSSSPLLRQKLKEGIDLISENRFRNALKIFLEIENEFNYNTAIKYNISLCY